MTGIPDPRVDLDGFVRVCHQRMLAALNKFADSEDRIAERLELFKQRWEGKVALVEATKDLEFRFLVDTCVDARERARVYATVIQTEQVVNELIDTGKIRRTNLPTRYRTSR